MGREGKNWTNRIFLLLFFFFNRTSKYGNAFIKNSRIVFLFFFFFEEKYLFSLNILFEAMNLLSPPPSPPAFLLHKLAVKV